MSHAACLRGLEMTLKGAQYPGAFHTLKVFGIMTMSHADAILANVGVPTDI